MRVKIDSYVTVVPSSEIIILKEIKKEQNMAPYEPYFLHISMHKS